MKSFHVAKTTTLTTLITTLLFLGLPTAKTIAQINSPGTVASVTTQPLIPLVPHWQDGYFNDQGEYVVDQPSWGQLTLTGGSFTASANPNNRLIRRWINKFTGQVNLRTLLKTTTGAEVNAEVRIGTNIFPIRGGQGASQGRMSLDINVQAGQAIDFVFSPTSTNRGGDFTFQANLGVPTGLIFVNKLQRITDPKPALPIQPGQIITMDRHMTIDLHLDPPYGYLDPYGYPYQVMANVRSGASRTFPLVGNYSSGTSISFDAWTIGEFVDGTADVDYRNSLVFARSLLSVIPSIYGWNPFYASGDRWYRILGTNFWMSETSLFSFTPKFQITSISSTTASHVGLVTGNLGDGSTVYESYGGYNPGIYLDPLNDSERSITWQSGVQNQHSLGTFISQSTTSQANLSYWHMAIDSQYATAFVSEASALVGQRYLDNPYCGTLSANCFYTPEQHKGSTGAYSTVGYLEAIAERVGMNSGEGFIPDNLESQQITQIIVPASNGVSLQSLPDPFLSSPVFTPEGFEFYMRHNGSSWGNWLYGWLEASDFLLTDPDGFQLGFRSGNLIQGIQGASIMQSQFGKISPLALPALSNSGNALPPPQSSPPPTANNQCNSPNPNNPVENFFQFVIPDRKPGQYTLQLWGASTNARGVIGTTAGSTVVYPSCPNPNPSPTPSPSPTSSPSPSPTPTSSNNTIVINPGGSITVSPSNPVSRSTPEPSGVIGLVTVVMGSAWLKLRQRQNRKS